MCILCLERDDWIKQSEYPANRRDFEARAFSDYATSPGICKAPADYPINDDNSPIKVVNFNAVGGSTIMYTAHCPRLHPSDFRTRTQDGVGDNRPIDHATLEPFYGENDRMMGVAAWRAIRPIRRTHRRCRRCHSGLSPPRSLRGVDLAQIQNVALYDTPACHTLVLDNAPIVVRLAVLLSLGLPQKHDPANLAVGIRCWEQGRSSLQPFSVIIAKDLAPISNAYPTPNSQKRPFRGSNLRRRASDVLSRDLERFGG
jgi:choline dehydrogenase-like flavoprotein